MKRSKPWAIGLSLMGVILIVVSIIWITVIEPRFEKLPTDLDETFTIDATIEVEEPFQNLLTLPATQVSIERHQQAIGTDGDVLIIEEKLMPSVEIPEVGITQATLTMGVDRDSREYVSGYGDREREALWAYPIGVEKQDYILWSDSAGSAPYARYVGEEKIDGLKVYGFITDEKGIAYDVDLGSGPLHLEMDLIIDEKVEPHTGITVDGKSIRRFFMTNPAGEKTLVGTLTQQYSEESVAEKVSDAKHYKTQLLWATKYGLWLGIGLGIICLLGGCLLITRKRLSKRSEKSSKIHFN